MKAVTKILLSGGKKNEDGREIKEDRIKTFTINKNEMEYFYAIIMDGATGLGKNNQIEKNKTSAEWYVDFVIEYLEKYFRKNPEEKIEKVVKQIILEVKDAIEVFEKENNIKLEEYEVPSASLAILRTEGRDTEIFLLGDTETIIGYKTGKIEKLENPNQRILNNLDQKVLDKMVELSQKMNKDVIDTRKENEINEMLQKNRSLKNKENGYWTCEVKEEAVNHAVTYQLKNKELDRVVMATDGFAYKELEKNAKEIYQLLKEKEARKIVNEIREKEEEDKKCNQYPRFKKSDDLTLVIVEF